MVKTMIFALVLASSPLSRENETQDRKERIAQNLHPPDSPDSRCLTPKAKETTPAARGTGRSFSLNALEINELRSG
jgi:hypothetical protein